MHVNLVAHNVEVVTIEDVVVVANNVIVIVVGRTVVKTDVEVMVVVLNFDFVFDFLNLCLNFENFCLILEKIPQCFCSPSVSLSSFKSS